MTVSVGVVLSGSLKSLISPQPAVVEWTKCPSTRTHWLSEIAFVVVAMVAPVESASRNVPFVFRITPIAAAEPCTCRTKYIADAGFAVK